MLKSFFNKYKYTIILGLVSIILLICLCFSIRSCNKYKDRNDNNVVALTDSIKYYKTKTGEIYVSKTLLEGDLNTLKLVNDSLVKTIKDMNLHKPGTVVYFDNTVDNGQKDTSWVIPQNPSNDSNIVYPINITKEFNFNNKFRQLEGNVTLNDTTLGLNITKDKVFVDYTLAIEDNKVFLKSSNPYVQYNKIQGITIPQPKRRVMSLVIGPSINYSYDLNNKKFGPSIGLSITYGVDILNIIKK